MCNGWFVYVDTVISFNHMFGSMWQIYCPAMSVQSIWKQKPS